jgi:hypothetical protein
MNSTWNEISIVPERFLPALEIVWNIFCSKYISMMPYVETRRHEKASLNSTVRYEKKKTKKNANRRNASSGMLRRVALVRTDVSEELSASFIRVTRIGKLGASVVPSSQ